MKKRFCNVCGKEFNEWDEQESFGFSYHVGYGSIYDGATIELDMCCGCFDELMEYMIPECKISPLIGGD